MADIRDNNLEDEDDYPMHGFNLELRDSSDDDNEIETPKYAEVKMTGNNVLLTFNAIERTRFDNLKKEIEGVFSSLEREGITTENADINNIFNVLCDNVYINHFYRAINRAFTGEEKLSMMDIEQCLKVLLLCHFYQCSPTALFSKERSQLYAAVKGFDKELFGKFMKGLAYSDGTGPTMTMDTQLLEAEAGRPI